MSRMGMCHHFGCNHFAQGAFCERHTPAPVVMSAEYEAVRIDPTPPDTFGASDGPMPEGVTEVDPW